MGRECIEVMYPVGRFERSLVIIGGNRQMYEFMGEYVYLPLYRMVQDKDIRRLQEAIACCDLAEDGVTEVCVHILGKNSEYDTYVLCMKKGRDFEGYEIEVQNVSASIKQLAETEKRLDIVQDYLSMTENIMFFYSPEDEHFALFWQNYEQRITIEDGNFEEWEKRVLDDEGMTDKDKETFTVFCNAVRAAEHEQTHTFHGSFLTKGQKQDVYRIRFMPRMYGERKIIIGTWTILNEQTQNPVSAYLEGNYLDSMTQVMNKNGITVFAEAAVASGDQTALVMLDVDNFKLINDTYGHLFGDTVIVAVADVVKKVIGEHGIIGRVGGDEFLIVIDNYVDELNLRNFLRSIRVNVNSLFLDKVGSNRISCSMGVACSPVNSDKFRELYMIADQALYIAKEMGRNRYIIYKEELFGKFRMAEDKCDLKEVKDAFYSEKDMFLLNRYLGDFVAKGREALTEVLKQAAYVLQMDRIFVFWKDGRELAGAYPLSLSTEDGVADLLQEKEYEKLFHEDMLLIHNVHTLEYSMPKVFELLNEKGICSAMQHFLRGPEREIIGLVTVEECCQFRRYPKLAVQIFENMCSIINAVLLREDK